MLNRHFYLVSAACLVAIAALTSGQQYDENSVNQEDDYSEFEEQPRPVPTRGQTKAGGRFSQEQSTTRAPPVTILKQINRHNEDGSYTYGFEGSDGSFKIETKAANGEVKGKYGYVDDSGKVRVVEYGANRYGFQPNGEGITVPPPTLVDETKLKKKKVPASPLSQSLSSSTRFAAAPVSEEPEFYEPEGQLIGEQPQPQARPQPQPQQFASRTPSRVTVQSRPRPVSRPAAPAISRPSANFEFGSDFDSFQEPQSFGQVSQSGFSEQSFEQPSRSSFQETQSFGDSPVPARAQVAGAVPASSGPAPPRIVVAGAAPAPATRPSSRPSQVRPAPEFLFPQARQATRATARQFSAPSSFDELEKQYALPSGGSPSTHDVTFRAF